MDSRVSEGTHQELVSGDTSIYQDRKTCRACDRPDLVSVLDLGIQYLPRFVPEHDARLPKAPLHLVRCAHCGLLQLAQTVHPDLLYREFWYRSAVNQTMRDALRDVVKAGMAFHDSGAWLDIGANDGYLLSCLPSSFHRVACEPALNFRAELEEQADEVISDYFAKEACNGTQFEIITSAAMFYDLDQPGPFLDAIRDSLAKDGVWINQLNDAPTMLKANAFDAICHEHLCYYDVQTIHRLYRDHGLTLVGISHNDVNGGSVRLFAKRSEDAKTKADLAGLNGVSAKNAMEFAARIKRWREQFRYLLYKLGGDHWCYGASTKGGTLLQYLDCRELFTAVADKNPRKHGLKMVGSWIPITDESAMREAHPKYAVVLPWAFKDEFLAREAATIAAGTALLFPLPNAEICV